MQVVVSMYFETAGAWRNPVRDPHIEAEEPRWQADGLPPSDPAKRAIEVFYDLGGSA